MKQLIPLVIASAFGLLMIAGYFVPPVAFLQDKAQEWFLIVSAIAFFIGGTNLVLYHLRKISDNEAGWGYSVITLAAFTITVVVGTLKIGVPAADGSPNYPWSGRYLEDGGAFWWLYEYIMQPITSTMFALLAFYVASAAFRAFRAKNAEALVLLATAFIVLLSQTEEPLRALVTGRIPERDQLLLPEAALWIRSVFNKAGQRAILIGIAMGVAATSLRVCWEEIGRIWGKDECSANRKRAYYSQLTTFIPMWQSFNHLDRRWIFLAMLIAVVTPMLLGFTSPAAPSMETTAVFARLEELPAGSQIALAIDYDPSSEAELHPMTIALIRHCCIKRHRMYFLTLWPTAQPVIDRAKRQVIDKEFADLKLQYGEDYVLLGYQPGEQIAIQVLMKDIRASKMRDDRGQSLDNLEMTKDVRGLKDMDLLVNVSAGYPGAKEWVQYAGGEGGVPIAAGSVGVQVPNLLPYLSTPTTPGRLIGMIGALRGAVEYETLLTAKYPKEVPATGNIGQRRMGPQLWAHLLIVALIAFGNFLQWQMRRPGGTA